MSPEQREILDEFAAVWDRPLPDDPVDDRLRDWTRTAGAARAALAEVDRLKALADSTPAQCDEVLRLRAEVERLTAELDAAKQVERVRLESARRAAAEDFARRAAVLRTASEGGHG